MKPRKCPECGCPLQGEDTKCPECGHMLVPASGPEKQSVCRNCGFPLSASATTCPECGHPVGGVTADAGTGAAAPLAAGSAPAGRPASGGTTPPASPSEPTSAPVGPSENGYQTASQLFWSCQLHKLFREVFLEPCDVAQRYYELFFGIWWECVKITWLCITTKFATFSGRASRREFFSCFLSGLWLLLVYILLIPFYSALLGTLFYGDAESIGWIFLLYFVLFIIGFLPWISVSVRRMHDINRSGWWILCPIAGYWFQFKKSDEGVNRYGAPNPINPS